MQLSFTRALSTEPGLIVARTKVNLEEQDVPSVVKTAVGLLKAYDTTTSS